MKKSLSNHEIVTLAVYLLGGESRHIDTEEVAVKANGLAPGRFTWRKHPDQINIENVRTFLSDAKKSKNGSYLAGSGKDGWILTEKGFDFARRRVKDLEGVDLSRESLTPREKQRIRRERVRMLASEAFLKFQSNGVDAVTVQEAEAFFRIDEYVTGQVRERKIIRILNTFGSDPELGQAVKELANKIRGGTSDGGLS